MPQCQKLDVNNGLKQVSTIKSLLIRNKNPVEIVADVNEIPCKVCELVYIGETGRSLDKSIKQHKYAVRTANYNNAIAKHGWDQSLFFDWENGKKKILYKSYAYKKRKTKFFAYT